MKSLRPSRIGGLLIALALCTLAVFMGTPKTVSASAPCQYANLVYFYAEPGMVTKVGQCKSPCNGPSVCTGTLTPYSTEIYRVPCGFTCP
jgi:hypothetical protein